jgi:hypothetical protein
MTTKAVTNACVSLCRQGKPNEVMERLLSVDIVRASLMNSGQLGEKTRSGSCSPGVPPILARSCCAPGPTPTTGEDSRSSDAETRSTGSR